MPEQHGSDGPVSPGKLSVPQEVDGARHPASRGPEPPQTPQHSQVDCPCVGPEALGSSLNAAAATAAKSLQSCPTLCDPIDGSPPGSPVPGILQARTLEWVAISFSNAGK